MKIKDFGGQEKIVKKIPLPFSEALPWFQCAQCEPEQIQAFIKAFKTDIKYWSYHDSCLFLADISLVFSSIADTEIWGIVVTTQCVLTFGVEFLFRDVKSISVVLKWGYVRFILC